MGTGVVLLQYGHPRKNLRYCVWSTHRNERWRCEKVNTATIKLSPEAAPFATLSAYSTPNKCKTTAVFARCFMSRSKTRLHPFTRLETADRVEMLS